MGSPSQHDDISSQQSVSNLRSFSGRNPFRTDVHSCSLFWQASKAPGNFVSLAQMYQKRMPKAQMSTEWSQDPPKSSGAMCIGVPTMVHVIMASGLVKPKSVSVPRFWASSCNGVCVCQPCMSVCIYDCLNVSTRLHIHVNKKSVDSWKYMYFHATHSLKFSFSNGSQH